MLGQLTTDGRWLFFTRGLRMFAYGCLSVVLLLYLEAQGLSAQAIGLILSATLLGDIAISLWIATAADRLGRRNMLVLGALLMAGAGLAFALTGDFWLLIVAATIGVLSPSDKEVGPFLSIEQAALAQTVDDRARTGVFAWYNLVGSLTAAVGALAGGLASQYFLDSGAERVDAYRAIVIVYAGIGVALAGCFLLLRKSVEAHERAPSHEPPPATWLGLHRSRSVVLRLSALFALDAFGGGFILQSIVAAWFHTRFGMEPAALGTLFFVANLLAAASALSAARLAKQFGLIRTMVYTHLPSNVLLILVPLMPDVNWAIGVLLLRFSISQMDVPTRQSYTMSVVHADERSAASGITTVARSIGAAFSPSLAGLLMAHPALASCPFFIAGGVKIVYDLLLYRAFVTRRD